MWHAEDRRQRPVYQNVRTFYPTFVCRGRSAISCRPHLRLRISLLSTSWPRLGVLESRDRYCFPRRNERDVHQMFTQKPDLHLIRAQDVTDQIIGAVVTQIGSEPS
jgi:hypothetical protein